MNSGMLEIENLKRIIEGLEQKCKDFYKEGRERGEFEGYKRGYDKAKNEAYHEIQRMTSEMDREVQEVKEGFFKKGWAKARDFHTRNGGWVDREKAEQQRREQEQERARREREQQRQQRSQGNNSSSDRIRLSLILGVDHNERDIMVWKKAKKSYLFKNHPDRNPNSRHEDVAMMNALWDKVFK